MDVTLAQPRGFCAGVVRAIEIVEQALENYGTPVYVLHEIVHNHHVIANLKGRGAIFVETLAEVPEGAVTIFSAHGVATAVTLQAEQRQLRVIDATCPLVTKVHLQAMKFKSKGYEVIILGHPGHPEVEGTQGQIDGPVHVLSTIKEVQSLHIEDPDKLAYVTQTTLSVDDTRDVIEALKSRFPNIHGPHLDDICYATQNRQNAVRQLVNQVDLLLVVGAHNSSNSNRLREVGEQCGIPSFLIQDASDINSDWFSDAQKVGVTAGASTPEILVQDVLKGLRTLGVDEVKEMKGIQETVTFRVPFSQFPKPQVVAEQTNDRSL